MNDNVLNFTAAPKKATSRHKGCVITITYNPNAANDKDKWLWVIEKTQTVITTFTGTASTENRAKAEAKKQIDRLED